MRRITQKPVNIVFSVLDFNVKPGLQQIGVQHTQQIDQQLNQLKICGNSSDQQLVRDILQAHFNLNSHGNQETNFQLFSVILDKDNQLTQLGQYDIYFTIRNRLVA